MKMFVWEAAWQGPDHVFHDVIAVAEHVEQAREIAKGLKTENEKEFEGLDKEPDMLDAPCAWVVQVPED